MTNVTHTPQTPTAGETFEIEVTVQNYEGSGTAVTINEIYAGPLGSDTRVADDLGTLAPGASMTVTLPMTIDETGWHTLSVKVNGVGNHGGVVTIRHPVTVHVVEEHRPQVEVSAAEAVAGARRPVNVTVANGGTADIQQVSVDVASPRVNFSLDRRVRARLAAGNATTFEFPATVAENGKYPVNVTVHYTENGDRKSISRTLQAGFDSPGAPGEVALTGVDAVARGGTLELSATASNLGTSSVEGVVVSVAETETVDSADYFVGSVDASDFSSFTLTTTLRGNVSSVPVEVRYVVDGVERSYTTEVPVERAVVQRPHPADGGGGPPLIPIAGAVAVVVVGVLVYRWRR
ncbi:MAG: CARDB domain-containing protein [Haloferacaceae archaeon]